MTKVDNTYNYVEIQTNGQKPSTASSTLGQDDFLKLLITELKHQNPLEPLDSKEYIAQLAQFSTLTQMQNMNSQIASLSAVNVIGRQATAYDGEEKINGEIKGIVFANSRVNLIIGDDEVKVPLENVSKIYK